MNPNIRTLVFETAWNIVNDVIDVAVGLAVKSYANEKLAELARFRSQRLSFVTHDLKNPLFAIQAAAKRSR
jgi:signal transduction histidine kinase